jgi:hypothetical protein
MHDDQLPDDQLPDHQLKEMLTGLRDHYNAPPETPREEMWSAIEARLGSKGGQESSGSGDVVSFDAVRRSRMARLQKPLRWVVAAAAVLVLGLGIGRMTAPGMAPGVSPAADVARSDAPDDAVLRVAALEHLVRTESLLTLVRADARAGGVEPEVGSWARGLLSQTRLLMDAQRGGDPGMEELLEDLELVLVQIVGVANASDGDQERVRSELNLALNGMEEREVLTRIQAVIPAGPRFVGT